MEKLIHRAFQIRKAVVIKFMILTKYLQLITGHSLPYQNIMHCFLKTGHPVNANSRYNLWSGHGIFPEDLHRLEQGLLHEASQNEGDSQEFECSRNDFRRHSRDRSWYTNQEFLTIGDSGTSLMQLFGHVYLSRGSTTTSDRGQLDREQRAMRAIWIKLGTTDIRDTMTKIFLIKLEISTCILSHPGSRSIKYNCVICNQRCMIHKTLSETMQLILLA